MNGLKELADVVAADPRAFVAALALVVSVFSLALSLQERQRTRIENVLGGLRGDTASVTYMALNIRHTKLLAKGRYRLALISSLLLAWNFENSDRARAAVLGALLKAKAKYPRDFRRAVEDLTTQFDVYGKAVSEKDIQKRGRERLKGVLEAIDCAASEKWRGVQPGEPQKATVSSSMERSQPNKEPLLATQADNPREGSE